MGIARRILFVVLPGNGPARADAAPAQAVRMAPGHRRAPRERCGLRSAMGTGTWNSEPTRGRGLGDAVLADLPEDGRPPDPEQTRRLLPVPARLLKRLQDLPPLQRLQILYRPLLQRDVREELQQLRVVLQVARRQPRGSRQNAQARDHVLELAHVAGP